MKRFIVIVLVGLVGCAPEPYARIKRPASSATAVGRPTFDASGLRLTINTTCHTPIVEQWCRPSDPQCRPDPTVVKNEPLECPQNLLPGKLSLRTPWARVYPGVLAGDVLDVKIDWKSVGVDPLADLDLATLRSGWVVHSDDGTNVDDHLDLSDDELRTLLDQIGNATGIDYSEAPAGEHAVLTVALSNQPVTGEGNRVVVTVTNRGPNPAYRVVAQLNSNAKVLEGIKLSFGRINSGETKKRAKGIGKPTDADDPNPTVTVEVTSSDAAPISATSKIRLKSEPVKPVQAELSCSSPDKQLAPGQRLRVQCEASNPGDVPIRGVTYRTAINKATPGVAAGPAELAPKEHSKFDLEPELPDDIQEGSPLHVTVTMTAPDAPPVEQEISVEIVEPHNLCSQGQYTIQDYRRMRKGLEEERIAGRITQEEFNDFLAKLWSCVRH